MAEKLSLADMERSAFNALEDAWEKFYGTADIGDGTMMIRIITDLLAARRAIHESGGTVCVVSRETREALALYAGGGRPHEEGEVFNQHAFRVAALLARDLAAVIKGGR
jgi:hypothetical protein